jgi:hypothetical protein
MRIWGPSSYPALRFYSVLQFFVSPVGIDETR